MSVNLHTCIYVCVHLNSQNDWGGDKTPDSLEWGIVEGSTILYSTNGEGGVCVMQVTKFTLCVNPIFMTTSPLQ